MARRWRERTRELARRAWGCVAHGSWRQTLCRLLLLVVLAGLAAFALVTAGLVPVAASSGHWPVTRVLLHFAMRQSVRTHSLGLAPPPPDLRLLGERALILKGAGHYATGCLPCHGAPGRPRSLVARQATPVPPYLPAKIDQWDAAELFWIVKHGVKFTAMPAWPSQMRDDEVWAMVAFLQRLPRLDARRFQQLAYGRSPLATDGGSARLAALPPSARAALADCTRCHGTAGDGRGSGAFPVLAGQREAYLLDSLQAFARGERHSGIMQPVAAGLDMPDMRALASYFAALPAPAPDASASGEPASMARGERIARDGIPERRVPSCIECHGPGSAPRNPLYPDLAGQHASYLALQLRLFRQGRRGGTAYAHVMGTIAQSLDERDVRDVARYYASLPPEREPPRQ